MYPFGKIPTGSGFVAGGKIRLWILFFKVLCIWKDY